MDRACRSSTLLARARRLLAPAVAALALAMPTVAGASEPFWTQRPDLTLQGNRLYASSDLVPPLRPLGSLH